ncbi:MAG TPA: hypothetical protein VMU93_03975 [Caulobacteraceae bacterium]|nr:hypothetical protein [Caulobacteraceae bacterium]
MSALDGEFGLAGGGEEQATHPPRERETRVEGKRPVDQRRCGVEILAKQPQRAADQREHRGVVPAGPQRPLRELDALAALGDIPVVRASSPRT